MIGTGAFALIALLTFGVSFALLDSSDDGEDVVSDPDPEVDEDEEIVIDDDSPSLIETGSGDDTITGSNSSSVDEINTRRGDDTIDVILDGATVYGGNGDDRINVEGYNFDVFGGAGDDTISGVGASVDYFGEEGDDHITVFANSDNDEHIRIYGGEGDDTIVSDAVASGSGDVIGPTNNVSILGGPGADQFEIEVQPSFQESDTGFLVGTTIYDFEPGEDILVIDPYSQTEYLQLVDGELVVQHATFTGFEIEPMPEDYGDGTNVILNYEFPDGRSIGTAIHLSQVTGVTEDDIQLVNEDEPAPLAMPA